MNIQELEGKKIGILGVGTEGLALVRFLSESVNSLNITVLDAKSYEEIEERLLGDELSDFRQFLAQDDIKSSFGPNYLDNLNDFDVIFRSPGISYFNEKIQEALGQGVLVSSQIKLFFDLCPCKIIGVTGTKGKGTTSSLIYEIVKKSAVGSRQLAEFELQTADREPQTFIAGNIGYPAITLIPKLKEYDVVILELSSFQLMDLDKSPHIGVVTNLSVDHLNYHKDVAEYRDSKKSIFKYQTENDFAVINLRSSFEEEFLGSIKSKKLYFGEDGGDAVIINKEGVDRVIFDPSNKNFEICNLDNVELLGKHNLENIAAAALACNSLGVDLEIIKEVVHEYKGLPHRLELIRTIDEVMYINDSFATNPEPTMAAIRSIDQTKILILGGSSKGADFNPLAKVIEKSNTRATILIGDEAEKIKNALTENNYDGEIFTGFITMDEIVKKAQEISKPGEAVILSPACASFDMFKNYKVRGEEFRSAVNKL